MATWVVNLNDELSLILGLIAFMSCIGADKWKLEDGAQEDVLNMLHP
jgi:hypothetical protein